MKKNDVPINPSVSEKGKSLIKLCHSCGHVHEAIAEIERCFQCKKSFLPAKYFEKIHDIHQSYQQLFSKADELDEKDLIKGLMILW
jgi:hypothetical protein